MKFFTVVVLMIVCIAGCKPKSANQKYYRDKFKNIDSVQVYCFRYKDTLVFSFDNGRDLVIFENIIGRDRENIELKPPFKKVVLYQGGKIIFAGKVGTGGINYTSENNKTITSRVGSSARQYLDQICQGIPKN